MSENKFNYMNEGAKNETFRFDVSEGRAGQRIDKALSGLLKEMSRARIQNLMSQGQVRLNGIICQNMSKKLLEGDVLDIEIPPLVPCHPQPEDIPLDIVYEDSDILVLNKPAGLVVHPGAGNPDGTLVNALLHHCGEELSGIGGVVRPGIVHRLDKETSGLMVVAKSDRAHQGLAVQLESRSLSRKYKALVLGVPTPIKGFVDQPIGRHPAQRIKMAVNSRNGRSAKTFYALEQNYHDACSLVECNLESGRTHQIRVHMAYLKHPLIGDPLYGPQRNAFEACLKRAGYETPVIDEILSFRRQALCACAITFIHPVSEEELFFEISLPDDFCNLLKLLN